MNTLLLRPDPGHEKFGLGPFFRVEPLGLEYIGAALLAAGYQVTVADLRFRPGLATWVRRTRPRIVGISCLHALEYDRIVATAAEVRDALDRLLGEGCGDPFTLADGFHRIG